MFRLGLGSPYKARLLVSAKVEEAKSLKSLLEAKKPKVQYAHVFHNSATLVHVSAEVQDYNN